MKSTQCSLAVEADDDEVEFVEGESLVGWGFFVNESAVHHFQNVIVVHVVTAQFKSILELFEVDHSVLVFVQKGKHSSDSVLGSDLSDWSSGDVNEFVEFNGSIGFFKSVDDSNDEGISSINA